MISPEDPNKKDDKEEESRANKAKSTKLKGLNNNRRKN